VQNVRNPQAGAPVNAVVQPESTQVPLVASVKGKN
jgi:hypothetical protein